MGGLGSGRRGGTGKRCVEDCERIDIRDFQRNGLLAAGKHFRMILSGYDVHVRTEPGRIRLSHWIGAGNERRSIEYAVAMVRTPCNLGGSRAWFVCPVLGCGQHVAVLYRRGYFACRHCHLLAYRSQSEGPEDRAARRANRIRFRLGWSGGIFNPEGPKPKGVHWRRYWALRAQYSIHASKALERMSRKIGRFSAHLDHLETELRVMLSARVRRAAGK